MNVLTASASEKTPHGVFDVLGKKCQKLIFNFFKFPFIKGADLPEQPFGADYLNLGYFSK